MGFRETLQASQSLLTESERRIGTVLLNDSQAAPLLTAAELARMAEVHESTVVRFAQKLGYPGYVGMRLDLASDFGGGIRRRPQPTGEEASLARVVRAQSEMLARLEDDVAQSDVDASMAAVLRANHRYVLGDGLVGPVAEFFGRKIAILGLPVSVVRQSGVELHVQLGMVRQGDVIVAFVLASAYDELRPHLDLAREQGAVVVLVTDQPIHTLGPTVDHLLAVPRSELNHGVFVSLSAVAYALDYSLMQQLEATPS